MGLARRPINETEGHHKDESLQTLQVHDEILGSVSGSITYTHAMMNCVEVG